MSSTAKPVRLILLADTFEWAERLRECLAALGNPYPLFTAPSWAAASCLLGDQRPSVLLSTPACLPAPGQCSLPCLLLLEQEPEAPPLGVSDWLAWDSLNPEVLRRCLRYACDQHRLKQTLERLTEEDALTGIANRQGFHTLLAARLAEFHGAGLTLGYLDLDNFRRANDALGQQAGDRLIQQVVQRLKAQLTSEDQVARLGGDEFALLLDTRRDAGRALQVAERLTAALAEPYWVDGESLLIGCSLGLARAEPGAGADPLMWHAHLAMQQAKSTEGCVFHLYDARINRSARSQAVLESELRHALRRDELELHYQPRLCLQSNQVVGLEALVRWRHPERGLLSPAEFVPLAEESGLIVPLGYWVIARALRDMQWLKQRGIAPLHMAINLSFRQFQDSQLRDTLSRLITEHGVDAAWLEFELTETAIMRRSDQVRATMLELGQLGVRFSLDDFGTGFSSFVHLNSLPISLLKIDMSFVAGMFERGENQKLVRAMIDLAHNLDLQVVAEGVEQPDQLERLRDFGCDQVQGYLISCPLPLMVLTGYLSARARAVVG